MSEIILEHHAEIFDDLDRSSMPASMKAVQRYITPKLKKIRETNGTLRYSFLRKDPQAKHRFTKAYTELYEIYLAGDYEVVSDFDTESGKPNRDLLCRNCPNFQKVCSKKRTPKRPLRI